MLQERKGRSRKEVQRPQKEQREVMKRLKGNEERKRYTGEVRATLVQ